MHLESAKRVKECVFLSRYLDIRVAVLGRGHWLTEYLLMIM